MPRITPEMDADSKTAYEAARAAIVSAERLTRSTPAAEIVRAAMSVATPGMGAGGALDRAAAMVSGDAAEACRSAATLCRRAATIDPDL